MNLERFSAIPMDGKSHVKCLHDSLQQDTALGA